MQNNRMTGHGAMQDYDKSGTALRLFKYFLGIPFQDGFSLCCA